MKARTLQYILCLGLALLLVSCRSSRAAQRAEAERPGIEILSTKNAGALSSKVFGQVVDAKTLAPIPLAKVFSLDKGVGVLTDQNGEFELKTSGEVYLQITDIGYNSEDTTLNILPGQQIEIRVKLGKPVVWLDN